MATTPFLALTAGIPYQWSEDLTSAEVALITGNRPGVVVQDHPVAAGQTILPLQVVGLNEQWEIVPALWHENEAQAILPIGIAVIGVTTGASGDAPGLPVYRAGCFNPDALNWPDSFDTPEKRLAAFDQEGTLGATNIILRAPGGIGMHEGPGGGDPGGGDPGGGDPGGGDPGGGDPGGGDPDPELPDNLVDLFAYFNDGFPAYQHPSETYITEATGTLQDTAAWVAQADPGGNISFADGKVSIPANEAQQVVRVNLAQTVPNGARARVWWRRTGGTGSLQPRLGPTTQNVVSNTMTQLGWFSADIEANSDKTFLEFRVPGGTGDVTLSHVCVEVVDLGTPLDIIVLAGQSNMVGASSGSAPDPEIDLPHPDVWVMHGSSQSGRGAVAGGITGAAAPLQHRSFNGGLGPGMSFARWYAENKLAAGRKVLLIAAAEGGTSLVGSGAPWNRNGSSPTLYNAMIADAQAALALNSENRIVALYWSQGEADRGEVSGANYPAAFTDFVAGVRTDLGDSEIPFVISGLNPNSQDNPETTAAMIAYQAGLDQSQPGGIPGVFFSGWDADAWGDGTKEVPDDVNDTVHFGTDANRVRGVAAARALALNAGGGPYNQPQFVMSEGESVTSDGAQVVTGGTDA